MKNGNNLGSFRRPALCLATAGLLGIGCVTMAVAQTIDDDEGVAAASFPEVEQKLKRLRKRVKQLEADVGELQALNAPVEVNVNCGSGGSIGNVLTSHAAGKGHLTIHVEGTCNESVVVSRDNVTIQGQTGAVVQAPASNYGVVVQNGAKNVSVSDLRVVGTAGAAGAITVSKAAQAVLTNLVVEQGIFGVSVVDNGTVEVTGSTMRNGTYGVYAARGGVALVSNSTIESNGVGLLAFKSGTINLTSIAPSGAVSAGVVVRNNNTGGVSRSGGLIELVDSRVESNNGVGLLVDTVSSLHFFVTFTGAGNTIANNSSVGVLAQRNSSLIFADSVNTITGNSIGILCQNNPSYVVPAGPVGPGNVTGNTGGNIVNCVP